MRKSQTKLSKLIRKKWQINSKNRDNNYDLLKLNNRIDKLLITTNNNI